MCRDLSSALNAPLDSIDTISLHYVEDFGGKGNKHTINEPSLRERLELDCLMKNVIQTWMGTQ